MLTYVSNVLVKSSDLYFGSFDTPDPVSEWFRKEVVEVANCCSGPSPGFSPRK